MTSRSSKTAACMIAVGALLSGPALAADAVSQKTPSADACTKTVSAMGAAMSHTSETSPDGRQQFRFLLRTNGLDYEAVCDAETGVVRDVAPRMSH